MKKRLQKIKDCLTRKKIKNFEIFLERSWGVTAEVQENQLEALEKDDSLGFSIRILKDKRLGFSFGTDFSNSAIEYVVDQALASLPHTTADDCLGWPGGGESYPKLNQWDSTLSTITTQQIIDPSPRSKDGEPVGP